MIYRISHMDYIIIVYYIIDGKYNMFFVRLYECRYIGGEGFHSTMVFYKNNNLS